MIRKVCILTGVLLFLGSAAGAGERQQFDFAGVKTCKSCHRKVWKTWKETPMAKAFDILKPGERAEMKKKAGLDPDKDYTKDTTCLPCHTTGYGQPGGFVSVEKTPAMVGISCEACHGAGTGYNKVMKKHGRTYTMEELVQYGFNEKPRTSCGDCHNEKSPTRKFQEEFDAADYDWPGHDPVKLKYHTPEYQVNK